MSDYEPDCGTCCQSGMPDGCDECGRVGEQSPYQWPMTTEGLMQADPWAEAPF